VRNALAGCIGREQNKIANRDYGASHERTAQYVNADIHFPCHAQQYFLSILICFYTSILYPLTRYIIISHTPDGLGLSRRTDLDTERGYTRIVTVATCCHQVRRVGFLTACFSVSRSELILLLRYRSRVRTRVPPPVILGGLRWGIM